MKLAAFQKAAQEFVTGLGTQTLILLSGDLGAGKTEFVKAAVTALGGKGVASPTFALHHQYKVTSGFVDHWDLYRLESLDDLESSGFWDQFARPHFLIFVEWPERLPADQIPTHIEVKRVQIVITSPESRELNISKL